MNKYKLTQGLLALALLAVPMISCTDSVMDDINVDKITHRMYKPNLL